MDMAVRRKTVMLAKAVVRINSPPHSSQLLLLVVERSHRLLYTVSMQSVRFSGCIWEPQICWGLPPTKLAPRKVHKWPSDMKNCAQQATSPLFYLPAASAICSQFQTWRWDRPPPTCCCLLTHWGHEAGGAQQGPLPAQPWVRACSMWHAPFSIGWKAAHQLCTWDLAS